MYIEFKSNIGCGKRQKELTEREHKVLNDIINQFEEDNPRRKKIMIDLDFVVPLIVSLREKEK
jgi:hypothetical protein